MLYDLLSNRIQQLELVELELRWRAADSRDHRPCATPYTHWAYTASLFVQTLDPQCTSVDIIIIHVCSIACSAVHAQYLSNIANDCLENRFRWMSWNNLLSVTQKNLLTHSFTHNCLVVTSFLLLTFAKITRTLCRSFNSYCILFCVCWFDWFCC